MPVSAAPRKARPQATPKKPNFNDLQEPWEECQCILTSMAISINMGCKPGRVRLRRKDTEEFNRLKTSTNKDFTELQSHLNDVKQTIDANKGVAVNEDNMMVQLNLGETMVTILARAQCILGPDIERLLELRRLGEKNQQEYEVQQASLNKE